MENDVLPDDFTQDEIRIRPRDVWRLLDQVVELSNYNSYGGEPQIEFDDDNFQLTYKRSGLVRHYLPPPLEEFERITSPEKSVYRIEASIETLTTIANYLFNPFPDPIPPPNLKDLNRRLDNYYGRIGLHSWGGEDQENDETEDVIDVERQETEDGEDDGPNAAIDKLANDPLTKDLVELYRQRTCIQLTDVPELYRRL